MDIGNKIKNLRLRAGITQETLASEMGVSSQSVSKWENNVCAPDISLLPILSEFFGVTIDELFDLSTEQKLTRIEKMYDYEAELSDVKYRDTERFLLNLLDNYDNNNPDKQPGRIESLLAHLYHHRLMSEGRKVSDYARRAMRLHPDVKQDQWLLQDSEYAVISDWNCANHNKTITFYKELVKNNPTIGRNYLYLLDNLIADRRTVEARHYLEIYSKLEKPLGFWININTFRILMAECKLDEAKKVLINMEEEAPEDTCTIFELAGSYASLCEYDKAVELYERSYELDKKPRYYDALWGISTIYEIQGKIDEALKVWDRIKLNLTEEWKITEGASIEQVESEKKRLMEIKEKQQ